MKKWLKLSAAFAVLAFFCGADFQPAYAAVIKSGASSDQMTVDATSKASRSTEYDTAGRAIAAQSKQTYSASGSFTPVATPTDLVTIYGSATKTIRVLSMQIGTVNTAAGSQIFHLIKRSAVNTTGTFVAGTAVPHDSTNGAATATVGHYTANPGGLGAAVGTLNIKKVASTVVTPTSFAGVREESQVEMLPKAAEGHFLHQPVTLIGVAQGLAINFNGVALVAGQIHTWSITWTEE